MVTRSIRSRPFGNEKAGAFLYTSCIARYQKTGMNSYIFNAETLSGPEIQLKNDGGKKNGI
ncbi:hypothetical protein IW492_07500 [Enterococcus sp. BWB1-3]|uniref:hypothetical protein n=1 Tax=Enterococcus sp. BWB1-3 TaxID=2787713 RepID=UPI001F4165A4|nr:hypothetical protein [Enterococcus sp. BWB1-3]MBL1229078.1 hypothetical protein [Enterococcus sp. BWB1-3]